MAGTGAWESEASPNRSSYLVERLTNLGMLEAISAEEDKGKRSETMQLIMEIQQDASMANDMKVIKNAWHITGNVQET